MKTTLLFLVLASVVLSGCHHSLIGIEHTTNLGFGFRRVVMAEPVNVSFESLGHFNYLYYKDKRLCQVGVCSVSPSGKYAVYQDGPSGNFFLFRRADSRQTQLTSQFVALAQSFDWHEDSGTVAAYFASGHGVQTFELP